jgi:hypothetical protein
MLFRWCVICCYAVESTYFAVGASRNAPIIGTNNSGARRHLHGEAGAMVVSGIIISGAPGVGYFFALAERL